MDSFRERLKFLWNDAKPAQIARDLNWSISGVLRLLEKDIMPKAETLVAIQQLKKCDWNWLMTGEGMPYPTGHEQNAHYAHAECHQHSTAHDALNRSVDTAEFVFIPNDYLTETTEIDHVNNKKNNLFTMAFRKFWIDNYLRTNPEELSVMVLNSDSMAGVLNVGDSILINHEKNSPGDGLYVLRIDDTLMVKRTQLLPKGKLLITSANEAYAPFEISTSEPRNDVSIVGKVEWFGRQL